MSAIDSELGCVVVNTSRPSSRDQNAAEGIASVMQADNIPQGGA